MKPIHVLFCGKEFPSAARNVARILAPHKQISVTSCEMRNVARHLPDADVAVPLMSRLDATLLNKAKKLRLIQQWGVGLEGVDTAAAHRLGIPVDNTPSTTAGSRSTAEMAVQLLLCALRHTLGAIRAGARCRERRWPLWARTARWVRAWPTCWRWALRARCCR